MILTGSKENAIPNMKAIVIPSPPLSHAFRIALTGKGAEYVFTVRLGLLVAFHKIASYKKPENSPTAS